MLNKQWKRFVAGLIGYLILLPVSLLLLRIDPLASRETMFATVAAVLVALLPAGPFIIIIISLVGQVREQDELYQRMNLESVLITALVTGGLTFSYGLLEAAGLVPPISFTFIGPFMILVWGAANAYVSRRYG